MKPFFAFGEWHSYGEMEEVNTSSVSPELVQSLVCSRLLKNLPLEQLHRKTIFKKNTKVMNKILIVDTKKYTTPSVCV